MKKIILFIVMLVLAGPLMLGQTTKNIPERHPVVSQDEIIANIENTIARVMQDWKSPGMGVSLYKDGQVILSKGYGVKSLETGVPVDAHTLFQIGSVSKSFTAAVLAQLADEGLISWDDPVKKHLPDFEMYDPWVTEHLQIKEARKTKALHELPFGLQGVLLRHDHQHAPARGSHLHPHCPHSLPAHPSPDQAHDGAGL